jgi:hypothetical protein
MEREAESLFGKPLSISGMNRYFCVAEMSDLLYVCGVIKMAVGKHDGLDLITIRFNLVREDASIDEDVLHDIGISQISLARDPSHRHAYY